jgi:hypothetical protein
VSASWTGGTDRDAVGTITALASNWTMCGWLYLPSGLTGNKFICDIDSSGTVHQRFRFDDAATGTLFARAVRATQSCDATSSTAVTLDAWNFVAATLDAFGSTMRLYIGDQDSPVAEVSYASQTAGSGAFTTGGTHCHIGNRHAGGQAMGGRMRNFIIINRTLPLYQLEVLRLGWRIGIHLQTPVLALRLAHATDLTSPLGPVVFTGTSLTDAADPPVRNVLV